MTDEELGNRHANGAYGWWVMRTYFPEAARKWAERERKMKIEIRDLEDRVAVLVDGREVRAYEYRPGLIQSYVRANSLAHGFVDGWRAAKEGARG